VSHPGVPIRASAKAPGVSNWCHRPNDRACGQRDWTRQDTRWFCRACWRLATAVAPSDAELATARTAAETARLALAIAEAQAHTAAVDQVRTRAALGVCDAKRLASLRPAWQAALLHRLRPARYPRTPAAARWLDEPVLELVREFARCHAVDPKTAGPGGLARLALEGGPHDFVRVGYETVHDFAGLLDNVAQTTFVDAYGDVTRSFEPWTSAVTVADFRSTIGTWNEFPDLREVPEHGEYVAGSPFGPAAPVRLTTFGRIVGLTRQALLRDDLATAGQLVQALGVAAAHVEADAVYELLTSNPTLPDGQSLFSAAHGNLLPAAPLDAASLAAACAADVRGLREVTVHAIRHGARRGGRARRVRHRPLARQRRLDGRHDRPGTSWRLFAWERPDELEYDAFGHRMEATMGDKSRKSK